jgi:superfamily II DNA or RNA helicase
MWVRAGNLAAGQVLEGAILPERTEVVTVIAGDALTRLVGKGLETGRFIDLHLTGEQVAALRIVGGEADYRGDPLTFKLGVEAVRLRLAHEYDPFFSLSIARVDPLPHQLEAVYDYFLKLPRIRFLLADDAGAGKTIMAGLLLKELKMRGLVRRVLVVTPASLGFQWQREMKDRFREQFEIVRGADLKASYGTNPWLDRHQVITSLDWAKREDVRESLIHARWDLVLVDEAHRMSASDAEHKTIRYRLGELLSDHTDHLVLLTATPHKGDPENFCLVLRLLDRDAYADVRSLEEAMRRQEAPFYLRRTKEAMTTFPDPGTGEVRPLFRDRHVETVPFDLLVDERDFYRALTRYVHDQSARAAQDPSARGRATGFIMAMYQRRFASSLAAAVRSLERRRVRLHRLLTHPSAAQPPPANVDWEDFEELGEQQREHVVDRLEQAAVPVDRTALVAEIQAIDQLLERGRHLLEQETSSKLQKLRGLLDDRGVFLDPAMKLLVFTEHRDTLEWLVDRMRGWGLLVTAIHGGMKVGDRDSPDTRLHAERVFREEAQVMVATEAAGEGINLQFCWLMVNFDIPWSPIRLEQRMGRIHRYGQTRDCLIFNFVAINTFEGRVLTKLLDRLREIRAELGTDQVFDVVGEALPGNRIEQLIRDHYAGRTSEQEVIDQVAGEADVERFRRITQSALEGLARRDMNLSTLVGRMAEAKERRLVPEVVEDFFLRAAPLHELHPRRERDCYRLGRVPRVLVEQGAEPELERRFGRVGRQYGLVVFDKERLTQVPTAEWVTPGHPLFEAVRQRTERTAGDHLLRGAVFYEVGRAAPAWLEVFSFSVHDGLGLALHERLYVVEIGLDGQLHLRQPTLFLDLLPASDVEPPGSPPATREDLLAFVVREAGQPLLDEVVAYRQKQLDQIRRHVRISLDTLIDVEQRRLIDYAARTGSGEGVALVAQQAEQRLEELNQRRERRLRELESEAQITIADVRRLAGAAILPHPTFGPGIAADPEVESIAMEAAMRHERARGWEPRDVSAENRGFDILSEQPSTHATRFIEVKGRARRDAVALTPNEFQTACRLRTDYWLYVVYDCVTIPELISIQDPSRLNPEPITMIDHYRVSLEKVEASRNGRV